MTPSGSGGNASDERERERGTSSSYCENQLRWEDRVVCGKMMYSEGILVKLSDQIKGKKRQKKFGPFLDLCVSSLRRGHANLLCIVPILSDVPEGTLYCNAVFEYKCFYITVSLRCGSRPRFPRKVRGFVGFLWRH